MAMIDCVLYKKLNPEMQKSISRLEEFLTTRLTWIRKYFNDFTEHGINHSRRTLDNFCEILIKRKLVDSLDESHALIAICACLLHDIGMGPVTETEIKEVMTPGFNVDTDWRDKEVRPKHHERSEWWIVHSKEAKAEISWLPEELMEPIGCIVRGHRKVRLLYDEYFISNPEFMFLAAVLRLSDQMDLSPDRVELLGISRDMLPTGNVTQTREFLKHLSSAKVSLDDIEGTLILKSGQPLDRVVLEGLSSLYHLVEEIEETIEETKDVTWKGQPKLPRILNFDFRIDGTTSDNHVLTADYKQVWDHLSKRLYSPETHGKIAVREAITNAIDSCLLQKEIQPDEDYRVIVEHTGEQIIISDNGRGMEPRIIENHLKVLGSSYYHSPWFRADESIPRRQNVSLIGRYGIGTFSYNLVSDEYDILTSTSQYAPQRIRFSKKFAITIGPLERELLERGTIVTLTKSTDSMKAWLDPDTLQQELQNLFLRPRIPLVFKSNENDVQIGIQSNIDETNISLLESDTSSKLMGVKFHRFAEDDKVACVIRFSGSYRVPTESDEKNPDTLVALYLDIQNRLWGSRMDLQRQTKVLYRGLSLSEEHFKLTPFTQGLMMLLLRSERKKYRKMWEVESDSIPDACLDFDEGKLSLDLEKLRFIHDEVYSRARMKGLELLDGISKKLTGKLLQDPNFPWQLKHMLRMAVLHQSSDTLLSWWLSCNLKDNVIRSVFDGLLCWNPQEQKIQSFGEAFHNRRKTKVGVFSFMSQLTYLHNLYDEHKILYLKDRIMRKNPLEIVAQSYEKKIRKGLGSDSKDYFLCFPFFGDDIMIGSMKVFARYLQVLGFKDIVTK